MASNKQTCEHRNVVIAVKINIIHTQMYQLRQTIKLQIRIFINFFNPQSIIPNKTAAVEIITRLRDTVYLHIIFLRRDGII